MKTVFRGADVISPFESGIKDVLVEDGCITAVEEHIPISEGMKLIDASGMILTPGFVDIHVHGGSGAAYRRDPCMMSSRWQMRMPITARRRYCQLFIPCLGRT